MEQQHLDLKSIPESVRASHWSSSVAALFPGLEVRDIQPSNIEGKVRETKLGAACIWSIESVPQQIFRAVPVSISRDTTSQGFKLLIQLTGTASVRQAGRRAELMEGMFTLVDGRQPFSLDMHTPYHQILVQMPRDAVITRYAGIENRTATSSQREHPGDDVLRNLVLSLANRGAALDHRAMLHASAALIELLGTAGIAARSSTKTALLDRAVTMIEIHLADSDFTPARLATQLRVSRRYLDALFTRSGLSVSGHIWERRLMRAAEQLKACNASEQRISDICFSAGFEDPGHFARAFRRRFGVTPSAWRRGRDYGP